MPVWLIDLSLSQTLHLLDVIGLLDRVAAGVDPVLTCKAVYALLPDVSGYTFDQAAAFAARVYEITAECLKWDWSQELMSTTDKLADDFDFLRDGYLDATEGEVIGAVQQFVQRHRDEAIVRLLHPVTWSDARESGTVRPTPDAGAAVVRVGLDAWIIQDGNYGDFSVGQETDFALEFYPLDTLRRSAAGAKGAEHLGASRYRVRARVVFIGRGVWVIDAGAFLAFQEREPPADVGLGEWLEGEVYVGIDPFFYFEYLHATDGMPPLTYTWGVKKILRETTPWMEASDEQGRPYRTRDASRETFVPTRRTAAWHDDNHDAHYVLECEQRGGPKPPAGPRAA